VNSVVLGLVAGISGGSLDSLALGLIAMAGPLLLAWLLNRQRRAEKLEERAYQAAQEKRRMEREAEVAVKVEEAKEAAQGVARTLEASTTATAGKLSELYQQGAATHVLVNSNMTEEKQSRLDGLRRELVMMRALARTHGDGHAREAIVATEAAISSLQVEMDERRKAQEAVESSEGGG